MDLRQFIGCPFKDGGRGEEIDPITRKPFYDCYGLFQAVFRAYRVEVADYRIGCFATDEIKKAFEQYKGEWEQIEKPEAPCAVALRMDADRPQIVNHFGVYVGNGKFIHTLQKTNSIISDIHDEYWKRKIEGFYFWKRS